MLLARPNDVLTKERLTGGRWSFGYLHEAPMTSAFGFGDDGLVTGYANANEHSWWLDLQGRTGWCWFRSIRTTRIGGRFLC
jgi:hypothetical protein